MDAGTQAPTTHEILWMNEMLRLESTEGQKTQAMMAMIGDGELRDQMSAGLKTCQQHLKAMVTYCKESNLVQKS